MTEQDFINDSFQGVEEKIIEAIRLLGVNAMGIDPEPTRREALDELAMALTQLETGWERVQEVLPCRTEKPAPPLKPAVSPEPISFKSQEDLSDFIVTVLPNVNARARDASQAKNDADMKAFKERQALKRELLSPGEIYAEENFLTEAKESVEEILERLPDIEGDLVGEVNEAAIRAWSRLNMVLRWGTKDDEEEEDLDDSDNESADSAQEAENGSPLAERGSAQNGAAQ